MDADKKCGAVFNLRQIAFDAGTDISDASDITGKKDVPETFPDARVEDTMVPDSDTGISIAKEEDNGRSCSCNLIE